MTTMIMLLQTAGEVNNFLSPRPNSDIEKPQSSFKSRGKDKRAKYKVGLLIAPSSRWKILVAYLQNTIIKQK